uniref:Conjugative transfer protein n=1 Tax=Parastrongyloides trichosuri TaxID=131310 RepID=A0A0N4ZQA5_PARTI
MKNYCKILIIFSYISLSFSITNDGSAFHQKACDRLINLVTSLFPCSQITPWFQQAVDMFVAGDNISTVASNIVPTIMGSLTVNQNTTIITKGAPLIFTLGVTGIQDAINAIQPVMTNNLMPMGNQLETFIIQWNQEGMDKTKMKNQLYYYTLSFFTKKRIGTLMKRYKHSVGDSNFNSIKSAFGSIIFFNLYSV